MASVLIGRRRVLLALAAGALGCAGPARYAAAPRIPGRRVVVVGAGLAGLAAATCLKNAGAEVTVVESLARVGGRVYAVRRAEWDAPMELGAQFSNDHYRSLFSLFGSVPSDGTGPPLAPLGGISGTVVAGKVLVADADHPMTYVSRGLLGFGDALGVAVGSADLASAVRGLPLDDYGAWAPEDGELAVAWARRNLGARATDYLAAPAMESLFFHHAAEMSAAAFKWMMAHGDRSSRWYTSPTTNHAAAVRVAAHLAATGVTFRTGTAVERVEEDGRLVRVTLADGARIVADGAVITAPAPEARRALRAPSPAQTRLLTVEHAATIVVNVTAARPEPALRAHGRVFGVVVPRIENRAGRIAAFMVESGKTGAAHGGRELYGFHLRDDGARSLSGKSDEAVVDAVVGEAAAWLPSLRGSVADAVVQRWPFAVPKMRVGHAARCRDLWAEQSSGRLRVLLAGDQTTVATMDGAAWSGLRAAALLAKTLAA